MIKPFFIIIFVFASAFGQNWQRVLYKNAILLLNFETDKTNNNLIITSSTDLVVKVHNIEKGQGIIWVGLYDSERTFLDKENAILVEGIEVNQIGDIEFRLKNLQYGTYAMALVHDENYNGTMDRNFIGIPIEPYGFSVKPVSKWRLPRFHEVKFNIERPMQVLEVELERW